MAHLDEFTLNEYLDDALDAAAWQAADRHLAGCAACRAQLATLEHLQAGLADLPELALTTDLAVRVVAELDREAGQARWPWLLTGLQAAAAVGMLLLLWPTLQRWLPQPGQFISNAWAGRVLSLNSLWAQAGIVLTTVVQQLQMAWPTPNLAPSQWGWLLGLALLFWLAGNGLLLDNLSYRK